MRTRLEAVEGLAGTRWSGYCAGYGYDLETLPAHQTFLDGPPAVLATVTIGPGAGAVLIAALGLISVVAGVAASIKYFRSGNYLAFVLDIIGVVGGVFSLGLLGIARVRARVAEEISRSGAATVRALKTIVAGSAYATNASRVIGAISDVLGLGSGVSTGGAYVSTHGGWC